MTKKEIYVAYLERTLTDTEKALKVAEGKARDYNFYVGSLTKRVAELKRDLEGAKNEI